MSLNIESIFRRLRRVAGVTESQRGRNLASRFYSFILDMLTLGRGIPRVINGEEMVRLDPVCRFLGHSYEPEVCAWLKSRIKPGDVVLDVGAQIGLYAMFFARWVGPQGHVYAFDPSPEAVRLMNRHFAKNYLAGRITVVGSAVGETNGTASLHGVGADAKNALVPQVAGETPLEIIQVTVTRLDSFCLSHQLRPSVIKIDTEGWELPILRGAGDLLKDESITWVVEMHPYAWTDAGYTRTDFEALLREYSMEVVPLTGQDDPLATYGDVFLRRVSTPSA